MKKCILLAVLTICAGTVSAQQLSMTNDSVVKMVKAGMNDGIIVSTINSQPAHFSLTVNDLIALKQAGVSDPVMAAMIAKNTPSANTSPAAARNASAHQGDFPSDIGLYYKDKNGYTEILPEIVNVKTGGFLKTLASDGIVKPDINGHLNGAHSPTTLTNPVQLLVVVPDGDSPTEYQLLRLHAKSKYREFRSVTGGVIHSSSGASRDDMQFGGKKVASRTYTVTTKANLPPGEYGFLPPGAFSSRNLASSGKIYSFRVAE
jgi:hypothetical protein